MQSLKWYSRRMSAMSARELAWRMAGKVREVTDRCLLGSRQRAPRLERILVGAGGDNGLCGQMIGPQSRSTVMKASLDCEAEWARALFAQSNALCENHFDLFDLRQHKLGTAVNWNFEHKAGRATPLDFAPLIDYRDYRVTGDCKFVWEPNRHQHLVVLARAYRLFGDLKYARTALEHLNSWMSQCPYGIGMNWRSSLELGIRLINWCWTLELIRPAGLLTPDLLNRLFVVVYRHLWHITRTYSRFSSANNHLIGEAAGVYIASSYFENMRSASRWREQSGEILCREILLQTHPDGGTREQAMGYHLFVLEFFLLCYLVGKNTGRGFSDTYRQRLEAMCEFLAAFLEAGGSPPMFGDSDDGYVLDLGGGADRSRALLGVAAVLFDRHDFKRIAGQSSEPVFWLLGPEGCDRYRQLPSEASNRFISSRSLPDSGYYLLQSKLDPGGEPVSVTLDCGQLGFGTLAAHGHADALSLTLRVAGQEVLVDPGTYDYFTYPAWRRYFRSTRAHNTVAIDDRDQSEMMGSFLWGSRANSRCVRWEPSEEGGVVAGEHDGYESALGVVHRRTVSLIGSQGEIEIIDEIEGHGQHRAAWFLHFSESCGTDRVVGHRVSFRQDATEIHVDCDERLILELWRGSENPIAGWVSRGYHRKVPAYTLAGVCEFQDRVVLRSRISICCPADRATGLCSAGGAEKGHVDI